MKGTDDDRHRGGVGYRGDVVARRYGGGYHRGYGGCPGCGSGLGDRPHGGDSRHRCHGDDYSGGGGGENGDWHYYRTALPCRDGWWRWWWCRGYTHGHLRPRKS